MPSLQNGSVRLFRFAGIDLFLHWSWFLVAAYEINGRTRTYSSLTWNFLEYLSLFLIVMLHEYGHALACRQVGGNANRIVLWPLGGVAYVDPPPRPGATLWSIAAGPLVNVALIPILLGLGFLSRDLGWAAAMPNVHALLRADSSRAAVVRAGTRPQPDGHHIHRFCRCGWVDRSGYMDTLALVRHPFRLHLDQLLARASTRAGAISVGKAAAPPGICLSVLPNSASTWRLLEVRPVRSAL
jgi:hypothetical protein